MKELAICLDFLKPKTRINKKVDKKMCLAETKTQLFKKSYGLGSGKMQVRNVLNLWTSEVHKSKRAAGVLDIITVGRCIYENAPNISCKLTQTHQFSHTHPSHLFALHAARPHPHASQPRLYFCALLCALLRGKLPPLLLLSFFVFFNAILILFFFFFNFISV